MSLRARLTLLYTSLLGGILLIFGVVVYAVVSLLLIKQVDDLLYATARDIIDVTRVDSVGEIDMINLPSLELTANVYVQVWDRQGQLQSTSMQLQRFDQPLDADGLAADRTTLRDVSIGNAQLRVLSVPLQVSDRPAGTLQVATSLTVVNTARTDLLYILIMAAAVSMALAALASWLAIGQALSPLALVTDTALQISRADDLSRRIPYQGPEQDEVGQLIHAFNQTLGRLETLFTSQQRFLADVSHELRTPLTVIKGNVDLLRRLQTVDEESLSSIDQEANRLTRLVGDLLLLAQAEQGRLPLNKGPVELDTLLLEVFQEMRVLAGNKLNLKVSEIDQVLVEADRDRLKQVLINLVSNAIHYTPAGGEVTLSLGRQDGQACLCVRDTGPGIPAKDLAHIFDRFYRAEKARTRSRDGGFGLGLSIANWIINRHDGSIAVQSREGQGTTFQVWLPLAAGQRPAPPAAEA